MSNESNKALVRRFFDEVCNGRKPEVAPEIFASDFVYHEPASISPGGKGPEAMAQEAGRVREMTLDGMDAPNTVQGYDRLPTPIDAEIARLGPLATSVDDYRLPSNGGNGSKTKRAGGNGSRTKNAGGNATAGKPRR